MLQNRVDPFGNIIKTEARGSLWGNRGALHNSEKEILRSFKLKTWITCTLQYKGIRRQIMGPNKLTELFFLDEATSFSAGHRPCSLCRRTAYNKFRSLWLRANPAWGLNEKTSIKVIDEVLHKERINKDNLKITYDAKPGNLPEGTCIVFNNNPYLLKNGLMYAWSPFGYEKGIEVPDVEKLAVLTPKSIVHMFSAGYIPVTAI